MKIIDTYDANSDGHFYFFVLNRVKKTLLKDTLPKSNDLFSEQELIIIKKYLTKTEKGYLSSQDIANDLGIDILEVTSTIYKLKNNYKSEKQIKKLFSNTESILKDRNQTPPKVQKKGDILTPNDLEILAKFTGQINDLCLDISEISQEYQLSKKETTLKLKNIFIMLKQDRVYNQVITKYPEIGPMLKIRAKTLEVKPAKSNPRSKSNKIKQSNVDFIIKLYSKDENNKFYTNKKLAELYNMKYSSFLRKQKRLLKKFEEDELFRSDVLAKEPTLLKLQEDFLNEKTKTKNTTNKDIDFIISLYSKDENNKFYSFKKLAKLTNMRYANFITKKNRLLKRFEEDKTFKENVLAKEPKLSELQEEYNNSKKEKEKKKDTKEQENKKKNTREQKKIDFLIRLYKKKENNDFYTYSELAELSNMQYSNFITKKNNILKSFEEDKTFRKHVLDKEPTLSELQEEYNNSKKEKEKKKDTKEQENKKKNTREQKKIDFLIRLYKKKENNDFYTYSELAELFNMQYFNFIGKKNRLLKSFEEDKNFRKHVLDKEPTLLELQDEYKQRKAAKNLKTYKKEIDQTELSSKEIALTNLYDDSTKIVTPLNSLATNLKISPSAFSILKKNTIKKVQNNPQLKAKYQTNMEAITIRDYFKKANCTTVTNEELQKIKSVSRHCDIPNIPKEQPTKDKLLQGIEKLENSIYKDYASLCTTEQKAMLALRLGFFNNTIFGSADISNIFNTTKEEISLLTTECLKTIPQSKEKNQSIKKK